MCCHVGTGKSKGNQYGKSASAGLTYSGERFRRYFQDFAEQYRFNDLYSGGFYPYHTREEYWGYWSRYIYINLLFLEAAVGFNTPTIIKYSFWRMTHEWKNAMYACLNDGEAYALSEIKKKAICINGDIGKILNPL